MFKSLKEISHSDIGKTYEMKGRVTTVKQTAGPTLMIIEDGTGTFTFKAFLKPGARAYPEIDVGDIVKVKAEISKRNEGIEGEVQDMEKMSEKDAKVFEENIDRINEEKVIPTNTNFTIKSDMLDSQKDRFIKIATIIRKAIVDNRPIILRHNADCDGYSSGITIERAILAYMDEMSGGDITLKYQNYKRAPSKAPFYEYEDAIKDLLNWLRDKVRNNAKPPLVIVTDNGSTEEDILGMKQMLFYGADIVVVDHHYPGEIIDGKVEVDKYIKAHINPYLTGYNSNVSAGMLGYELANFIHKENNNSIFIPAMAAILDHTEGSEREQYIEQAINAGFTEEYLATLGEIIDMQSHYLKFLEAREFVDELYGNMKVQQKIVETLGPELEKRYSAVEKVARHYTKQVDYGSFIAIEFDGEKGTYRGEYPAIGKSTNHIHKVFNEELEKPVITMTYGSTFMTVRCADEIENFSVPEFAKSIIEKMPYTNADGGGHEKAGSVKFVEYAREDVLELFRKYLKEVANKQ